MNFQVNCDWKYNSQTRILQCLELPAQNCYKENMKQRTADRFRQLKDRINGSHKRRS